jgi:pyridoxamine 5'-phosphate oxidase
MISMNLIQMSDQDPIQLFRQWYREAVSSGISDPSVMSLATAGTDRRPSVRIVLLKEFDERGFVFFTNYTSRKAGELDKNPVAALLIHWPSLDRQVRIEGRVEKTSATESDRYYASRPRGSQIGAWVSDQSSIIPSREELDASMRQKEIEFRERDVPRPPHWGGYRLLPSRIEFWTGREDRMHDRIVFERELPQDATGTSPCEADSGWRSHRLAP